MEIRFTEQPVGGYNKQQVDQYITALCDQYRKTEIEFRAKEDELTRLKREAADIKSNRELISAALIEAEITASAITGKAQREAASILSNANAEAERIKAQAEIVRNGTSQILGIMEGWQKKLNALSSVM